MSIIRELFDTIDSEIGTFLAEHPKVKSAVRAALITIVVAAAEHYGFIGLAQEVFSSVESVGGV